METKNDLVPKLSPSPAQARKANLSSPKRFILEPEALKTFHAPPVACSLEPQALIYGLNASGLEPEILELTALTLSLKPDGLSLSSA